MEEKSPYCPCTKDRAQIIQSTKISTNLSDLRYKVQEHVVIISFLTHADTYDIFYQDNKTLS